MLAVGFTRRDIVVFEWCKIQITTRSAWIPAAVVSLRMWTRIALFLALVSRIVSERGSARWMCVAVALFADFVRGVAPVLVTQWTW